MGDGDGFFKQHNFEVEHGPDSFKAISELIRNEHIPLIYRTTTYIGLMNIAKALGDEGLLALLNGLTPYLFKNES